MYQRDNYTYSLIPKLSNKRYFKQVDEIFNLFDKLCGSFNLVLSPNLGFTSISKYRNPCWVEQNEQYIVEFELPRFKKENVKLTLRNEILHISAEQNSYSFSTYISIPDGTDVNTIKSKLENGVLTITAQKKPEAKEKVIDIE